MLMVRLLGLLIGRMNLFSCSFFFNARPFFSLFSLSVSLYYDYLTNDFFSLMIHAPFFISFHLRNKIHIRYPYIPFCKFTQCTLLFSFISFFLHFFSFFFDDSNQ